MVLTIIDSDRKKQKDSRVSIKQIAEYLSLEEGEKIFQKNIKYLRAARIENIYYWLWKYTTTRSIDEYVLVRRVKKSEYANPVYTLSCCYKDPDSSVDEMLIAYHEKLSVSSYV